MKRRAAGDDGFSYIETIMALCIVTLIASGLTLFVIALLRAPAHIAAGSREAVVLGVLDRELRQLAARIDYPFWRDGPDALIFPESLSVDWLDGDEDNSLSMEIVPHALIISENGLQRRISLGDFSKAEFAADSPDNGFRLTLEAKGVPLVFQVAWGGRPLQEPQHE